MPEHYLFDKPSITIADVETPGTPIEVNCHARQVDLVPEDEDVDIETFCEPGATRPGKTTWVSTVTALQSFGTDGLWTQLSALRRKRVEVVILPAFGVAVSVDNPSATFEAYMPSIPFLAGADIGQPSEVSFELTSLGDPTFSIVPPIARSAEASAGQGRGKSAA